MPVNYKILPGISHSHQPNFIEVYAHRGMRSFVPENSIPGYKAALKIGVDWVDMDVLITKDHEVIVYHDPWINPDFTSKNDKFFANSKQDFFSKISYNENQLIQPFLIKNITFKDLQKYDIGTLNPNSTYKKYFEDQIAIKNTHIPSLQQVINFVEKNTNQTMHYQIEIKNDPNNPNWTYSSKELATEVYSVIKKNNLVNRVELQSFDWEILSEIQKLDKNLKTAYLIGSDGLARMQNTNLRIAGLWTNHKFLSNYDNSLPAMVKALGGSCYEPEDVILTKKDLVKAHQLGLKVVVWTWPEHTGTAFNRKLINKLISWGVDGIITDNPSKLNAILAAKNYYVPKNYNLAQ